MYETLFPYYWLLRTQFIGSSDKFSEYFDYLIILVAGRRTHVRRTVCSSFCSFYYFFHCVFSNYWLGGGHAVYWPFGYIFFILFSFDFFSNDFLHISGWEEDTQCIGRSARSIFALPAPVISLQLYLPLFFFFFFLLFFLFFLFFFFLFFA